jgi:hypothetical protein
LPRAVVVVCVALAAFGAQAGLFDDEEARKAILDLRNRATQAEARAAELSYR